MLRADQIAFVFALFSLSTHTYSAIDLLQQNPEVVTGFSPDWATLIFLSLGGQNRAGNTRRYQLLPVPFGF